MPMYMWLYTSECLHDYVKYAYVHMTLDIDIYMYILVCPYGYVQMAVYMAMYIATTKLPTHQTTVLIS